MIAHIAGEQHRFRLVLSTLSERGGRASNEDYLGLIDLGSRGFCCALADGAGGHGNGALAARLTVDAVLGGFHGNPLFAPAGLASLISLAEHIGSHEQPTSMSRKFIAYPQSLPPRSAARVSTILRYARSMLARPAFAITSPTGTPR